MQCDESSKKGGFSAKSITQALEEQVPQCWYPGRIWMQDNAPIHTARDVATVLAEI